MCIYFQASDSLYNVPRSVFPVDTQLYDTPKGNLTFQSSTCMTPDAAIESGIYNVPRALLMQTLDDARSSTSEDAQYLLGTNPLDIYDYPRVSISPDEEGIYDDPLDIIDMEIYDYPPDAGELGIEEFPSEVSSSSAMTLSSELIQSDRNSQEIWKAAPPLPNGAHPSANLERGSSFDDSQVRAYNYILCINCTISSHGV